MARLKLDGTDTKDEIDQMIAQILHDTREARRKVLHDREMNARRERYFQGYNSMGRDSMEYQDQDTGPSRAERIGKNLGDIFNSLVGLTKTSVKFIKAFAKRAYQKVYDYYQE